MKTATIVELSQQIETQRVKGFLADDEASALYQLALEAGALAPCLEVGSYCGKSSIILGAACRINDGVLYAIDHHRGSEEHQLGEQYHDPDLYNARRQEFDSFPEFRKNIDHFALQDYVIPMVASSRLCAKHWTAALGMVFIDGGHSLEAAMEDCLSWSPFIVPGGVLAIHDIFSNPEYGGQGPYLALKAVLDTGNFEWERTVRSLGILRRLSV